MKYTEVEFKYRADGVALEDFERLCREKTPKGYFCASGYDYFYASDKDPGSFFRYRQGPDINQLTLKRKKSETNSVVRAEYNIDLGEDMKSDSVAAFVSEFGYKYSNGIFKNCFGFNYDWYTMVYYVCYDLNMKDIGRFIEIEAKEDFDWKSEEDALTAISVIEKLLAAPLGVSSKNRIKRSLFELYGKAAA